jgi:glycosyltransferase involved in cell wall biosynthesis
MGKEKIKILMHTEPSKTSFNAQDLNGRYIASKLDETKYEIYFINTMDDNIDEKLKKDNIFIHNVFQYGKFQKKLMIFYYKLLYKYDYSFYIRVFKGDTLFLKLKRFFDKKRKTIHMVESMVPYLGNENYNKYAKYNALHSDMTFSISKKVQETVKKEYGINTQIMHVGVDTSIFYPMNLKKENNKIKVVSCGTLSPMKQPLLFVEIAKNFPSVEFIWIGRGELRDEILKISKNVNNFTLLDNMPHQELAKFFNQADIFLFPSIHEGFPKVIVEAMASGLPVIAFNTYNPEAIINGVTGFIVSDEKEMIKKLKLLIENKELREKMGKEAVKRAKEFDWNIIVKQWEEILKEI